jgi:hypothetical protein
MSDNFNPKDLGVLKNAFFSESGTLDSNNSEDTFQFTLPNFGDIAPGRELEKVDLLYGFYVDFPNNLNQPVKLSIGTDSDSDGSFDQTNEILGSQITVQPDPFSTNVLINLTDIVADVSIPEDLLKPNQTLFLDIESTDPSSSNNYNLDFNLELGFVRELTTSDLLYCCDGSHNDKYYYDRLDELSVRAGENNVAVGDTFELALASDLFPPVLFLLNQDTGAVIDVASVATSETVGGANFQIVDLSFTVEDNINYVVSAESALPNQTGDYILSII